MNHFKHIFGVNIPRHTSSNAALSYYGQHTDVYFENRQFSHRSQLSKSSPLFVTKKSHGIGMKYSGQFPQNGLRLVSKGSRTIFKQRNRTKSSVISLQKKSSVDKTLENITGITCHYSICQNAKLNYNLINKRHVSQSAITRNTAKNIRHNSSSLAFIEKQPRSYAEIIADYSKALYKKSTNTQNDSLYFNNIIRQSPFSTSSISPLNKKLVCATEHDGIQTEKQENHSISLSDDCNSTNQPHRQGNINITECHNFQHYDTYANKIMNRSTNEEYVTPSDFKNEDQFYEKLISDCSKSMQISLASTLKSGLIPSRNVLTRNSVEIFGTPTRKASSTNVQGTLQKAIPTIATMPLGGSIKERTSDSKENDWLREIESVISDLRSASERKTARAVDVSKLGESRTLQSADASSNTLDRIQKLADLIEAHKQKERSTADKKLGECKYFSNTAKSLERKNVTQVPTVSGTASTLKQPQVELRMVPSEKESVVSINVDSASIGLSQDPANPASKQLSVVVVQSDRKEDGQPSEAQWSTSALRSGTKSASQRNDFGPMRISISEDSAPVKQIEFSINGKPVSELKSITARTERLDVVSSMDKIEIRIPFAKDDASSKTAGGDLSKQTDSNGGQILNVQIAANFQPARSSGGRSVGIINTTPISSQIPKSHYAFNDPAGAKTLGSDGAQQHGSSTWSDIRSDNTIEGRINEHETSDNVNLKIQRATTKKLSADKTMVDVSLIKKATDTKVRKWNTKKMTSTVSSETNKYDKNESSDPRVPSKVIPWWSSSDSFSKIRKKDDDRKPVAPTLNRNENKVIFNMNQDLVTQSFSSKSKETSSSKLQTKNADLTHDATTNNSNDLISYVDSVEQYKISEPSDFYSFKQEPNRANFNIIPKIRTGNLKTENSQTSDIKEDNKNSKIRQINPLTLSTLGTMNKQDKCNVSIEEKVSISPKSLKILSGQNLPLKKEQHSREQINLTDDISSMKSRTENIVSTIKPIEKRKDDILIDYGSKILPRKPIVKLNNGVEESQNAIIKKRRNLASDKYDEIRQNIKHDINATKLITRRPQINKKMSAKPTEVNETRKAEIKINILKKKEDLRVKNIATTDFKEQNKNDMKKNIKNMHNNDTTTSNSSNFRDASKLTQTLKKHEKLVEDTMQDNSTQTLKLLSKFNTSTHLSSTRNSSETIPKSKHQLGTLIKMPSEEPKQDKQKYLSSIRNIPSRINIEESEKLNTLTSLKSKDNHHSSKEFSNKKVVEIPTKSDKAINKIVNTDKSCATQTKPNPTLKTSQSKNSTVSKETVNKNAKVMPITNEKNDMIENTVAKTITQNSKIKSTLPKDSEDNHLHKSKSSRNKKNSSELDDSAKKTDDSTGSKTSDSKICVTSREQSIEFCRRPHQILKIQNPNNINSISEYVPSLIRNIGPDIDRPEKKELYSVWLQQPKNDNDEKLF